jgi:copper(I)-binding protein
MLFLAACAPAGSSIAIEGAWGRASPKVAMAGAFYMTIRNTGAQADRLVSATSGACGTVELHESYQTPEGAMGMRPVAGGFVEIPAGGMVELKVGGLHIMCIDKKVDFKAGVKIPLTLKFEKAGEKTLEIEIRQQ